MTAPPPGERPLADGAPAPTPAPAPGRRLGNLASRILTAAVLVPGIIALVVWRRPEGMWALVFAATLASLHEYFHIMLDDAVERRVGVALGAVAAASLYWWTPSFLVVLPACAMVPALFYLFRFGRIDTVAARLAAMSFGIVYAGVLLTFLALLKRHGGVHGGDWVFVVLMTGWFGDTGAYFAGRFLGRRKLYPAISPGKTWAGALGGLAGSYLGVVLANLWYFPELGWVHGTAIVLVGSALGQCGDLVESMLKRSRNVKDSGRLLPGHGGMLDRIDAVMFIAPWVFAYMTLVWRPW